MSFLAIIQALLKLLPLILQILGGLGIGSAYQNMSSGSGFGDPYVGVQGGISLFGLIGAPWLSQWIQSFDPKLDLLSHLSPDLLKRANFVMKSASVLAGNAEVNALFREIHGCDIPTDPKSVITMLQTVKNDVARLR